MRLERALAQFRDDLLHRVQRREHVGAAGAEYLHADRRIAVLVGEELSRRRRYGNGGDIREAHRPPVAPGQHQLAELLGRVAPGEAQRVLAPADVELTAGHIVGAGGAVGDIRNGNPERRRACQIHGDAHVVRRAGIHVDRRDAGHGLDARLAPCPR